MTGMAPPIDRQPGVGLNPRMDARLKDEMRALTERVDQLLALCIRLGEENKSLKVSQEALAAERANLLAKNEQARSRVEAMIARLKSLEQNG